VAAARAVFPESAIAPPIEAPATVRQDWTSVEARCAMVRGLMEVCGPIAAPAVAQRLSLTVSQAAASLEALEGEGVVLRGRFTPEAAPAARESPSDDDGADGSALAETPTPAPEWCHRRLLARIHRLTVEGLRRQIEPVDVATYWRLLARHHGLIAGSRKSGVNGLFETIAMLQGLDVPAVAWETDLLPARISGYQPQWLDELCLAGDAGWGRLYPPPTAGDRGRPMASITRVAPISVFLRSDLDWLAATRPKEFEPGLLSGPAQQVHELLSSKGATFASDLAHEAQMPPLQMEEALGELVTRGLVTADGFGGLRQLIGRRRDSPLSPTRRRRAGLARKRHTVGGTGRWSLWRPGPADAAAGAEAAAGADEHVVEQWAWQLLRRWGVVFRDLLVREAGAPSWYELLQVYRRLEARGEIRGGRFIAGVAGEQFAAADTVVQLRALRDEPAAEAGARQELVAVSAADPLNLVGILTSDPRVPSLASNRVVYVDGRPVAARRSDETMWFGEVSPDVAESVLAALGGPQSVWRSALAAMAGRPPEISTAPAAAASEQASPREPIAGDGERATEEASAAAAPSMARQDRRPRAPAGIPKPLIR
jgi:ATP-dependent Lhr-like helicase